MANNISYASKYTGELDKMIVQKSVTGFMADNAFGAKFQGSKTVYLPEVEMVGLGDYSRDKGYAKGDTTLVHTPYTLTQERSRQMFVDAQDADESGVPDLVGKMVGEYTRTHVVPEIDAYNISKLYQAAAEKSNVKTYSESTAVKDLLKAINDTEAAVGYDGTALVAFVDPTLYGAIMTSTELQRQIVVSDFKQGDVDLKIKHLNGCAIIPVDAKRMKSEYVFNAGSTTTAGGFTAADGAKNIRALVMPKDSGSFIKKVDKLNVFTPNEVEDYDAYKINLRLYYELIVKNSRKGTIFAISN